MQTYDETSIAKRNAKWSAEYMFLHDILDKEKEEAREEGFEQGAHDKAIESARNLLAMNVLTPEQISQATGLPLDEVLELKENK